LLKLSADRFRLPSLRRNYIIPLYWKYINPSKVLSYYQKLQELQWNSLEKNRQIQRKKLYDLLVYSKKNIPYYRQVFKKNNLNFSYESIFEDIKRFPILTKETIQNHFDSLYRFWDNSYYRNASGGSTGEPAIIYQDETYFTWANANKRLFNEWAGRKLGDPMIRIWSSPLDNRRSGYGIKSYLRKKVSGINILDASRISEKDMYQFVQKINRIKPRLILAFVNSIETLARFIREKELFVYSPPAVMTTAGVLFPELKTQIEEIFHTRVFNRYGSREVSDMACSCEKDEGLHLIPALHYIEIVDDHGQSVKPGTPGNILVTLLTNYTMPLIRYQIGDRGVLSDRMCSCGRGLPLLKEVNGRINSGIKNKSGEYIEVGFIPLFYYRDNIKQFQVIQESLEKINVNLALKDKTKSIVIKKDIMEITAGIKKIMGEGSTININLLDEIKASPSGKYMYVYSKMQK